MWRWQEEINHCHIKMKREIALIIDSIPTITFKTDLNLIDAKDVYLNNAISGMYIFNKGNVIAVYEPGNVGHQEGQYYNLVFKNGISINLQSPNDVIEEIKNNKLNGLYIYDFSYLVAIHEVKEISGGLDEIQKLLQQSFKE